MIMNVWKIYDENNFYLNVPHWK